MIATIFDALRPVYGFLAALHHILDAGRGVFFDGGDYAPEIFIGITLILGGLGAWASGRALASTWRPLAQTPLYVLPLAAAVRFLHYALYDEDLGAPVYFIATFAILSLIALLGFRSTRAQQMARQYSWAFARAGLFGWRKTA